MKKLFMGSVASIKLHMVRLSNFDMTLRKGDTLRILSVCLMLAVVISFFVSASSCVSDGIDPTVTVITSPAIPNAEFIVEADNGSPQTRLTDSSGSFTASFINNATITAPATLQVGFNVYTFSSWSSGTVVGRSTFVRGSGTITAFYSTIRQDFQLSASPTALTLSLGQVGTSIISVTSINGFSSSVAFVLPEVPSEVSVTLSPLTVTPARDGTSTISLTLSVSGDILDITPGTYEILIQAQSQLSGDTIAKTLPVTLTVVGPPLEISLVGPANGAVVRGAPVKLQALVRVKDNAFAGANVEFFVDGTSIGSRTSDSTGNAFINFQPSEERTFQWYAIAQKTGFKTATSDPWTFTFVAVFKVTVDAEPRVSSITVDGAVISYTQLPISFDWVSDSTHTISINTKVIPGEGGVGSIFAAWSDGVTSPSRIITVKNDAIITAKFSTVNLLSVDVEPPISLDVQLNPQPVEVAVGKIGGWYYPNEIVEIEANAPSGLAINSISIDNQAQKPGVTKVTLTMDKPHIVSVNLFQPEDMLVIGQTLIPPIIPKDSPYPVAVNTAYSFSTPTKIQVTVFDKDTERQLGLREVTLQGSGAVSFVFNLRTPDSSGVYTLIVKASYLKDAQSKQDPGGQVALSLTVVSAGVGLPSEFRVLPTYYLINYKGQQYKAFPVVNLSAPDMPEDPTNPEEAAQWYFSRNKWLILDSANEIVLDAKVYVDVAFAAEIADRGSSAWTAENLAARRTILMRAASYSNVLEMVSKSKSLSNALTWPASGNLTSLPLEKNSITKISVAERIAEGMASDITELDSLTSYIASSNVRLGLDSLSSAAEISKSLQRTSPGSPPAGAVSYDAMLELYNEVKNGDILGYSGTVLNSNFLQGNVRASLDAALVSILAAKGEKPEDLAGILDDKSRLDPLLGNLVVTMERVELNYGFFEQAFNVSAEQFVAELRGSSFNVVTVSASNPEVYLHIYDQDNNHVGLVYETGEVESGISKSLYIDDFKTLKAVILPLDNFRILVDGKFKDLSNATYRLTVESIVKGEVKSTFEEDNKVSSNSLKQYIVMPSEKGGLKTYGYFTQTLKTDAGEVIVEGLTNSTFNAVHYVEKEKVFAVDVDGRSGTVGFLNLTLPKIFVSSLKSFPDRFLTFIDGVSHDFQIEETATSYIVTIKYSHSAHNILFYPVSYSLFARVNDYFLIQVTDAKVTAKVNEGFSLPAGISFQPSPENNFTKLAPANYTVMVSYRGQIFTETVDLLTGSLTAEFTVLLSNFTIILMVAVGGAVGLMVRRRWVLRVGRTYLKVHRLPSLGNLPVRYLQRFASKLRVSRTGGPIDVSAKTPLEKITPKIAPRVITPWDALKIRYTKITGLAVVSAMAALTYFFIPFYPISMMFALAVASVTLAYIRPSLGLCAFLSTAAFALGYQLSYIVGGTWGSALLIWIIIIAFLSVGFGRTANGIIGVGIGALAGILLVTPYFFLSAPLLIAASPVLIRWSRIYSIILYITFYTPFLFLKTVQTAQSLNFVPDIYSQAALRFAPRIELWSLPDFAAIFNTPLNPALKVDPSIVASALIFDNFSAVYFMTILVATIFIVHALKVASKTYIHRAFGDRRLLSKEYNPVLGVISIIGCIFFISMLSLPQTLIGYVFRLSYLQVGGIFALAFVFGIFINMTLHRLHTVENLLTFRIRFEDVINKLKEPLQESVKTLKLAVEMYPTTELYVTAAKIDNMSHEVSLILSSYKLLGFKELEKKVQLLEGYNESLNALIKKAQGALVGYLEENLIKVDESLKKAGTFGFEPSTVVPALTREELSKKSIPELLQLKTEFDKLFTAETRQLLSEVKKVVETITNHVEPTVKVGTLEVATNYIEQSNIQKALGAINDALSFLEAKHGEACRQNLTFLSEGLRDLEKTLTIYLKPLVTTQGEAKETAQLLEAVGKIDEIASPKGQLAEILKIPSMKTQLQELSLRILQTVDYDLEKIEKEIDSLAPQGYNWARQVGIHDQVHRLIVQIEETQDSRRLSEIAKEMRETLKEVAKTLENYATTYELLINYPHVEPIISMKIKRKGYAAPQDIPSKYGEAYLMLYTAKNIDFKFDKTTKTVKLRKDIGENQ